MSLTVTQRPSQTIGVNPSTWNAVGNPIVYKMQRKDFTFNQVNNSGGFIQLQFNAVNISSSFSIGNIIYIKSDNSIYDIFSTVTASTFSTNTLVTVSASYISAAPGGFTNNDNLRQNYRVETELYRSDNDAIITSSILENSPTSKGVLTINISSILTAFLSTSLDSDITGSTQVFDDTNGYLGFYIKYREVWLESVESQTNDVSNQFFAVLGSRQIPSLYGGNMAEYAVRQLTEVLNDTAFNSNWTNEGSGIDWTLGATDLSVILSINASKRARRSLSIDSGKLLAFNLLFTVTDVIGVKIYLSNGQELDFGMVTISDTDLTLQILLTSAITYFEIESDDIDATGGVTITISDVIVSELTPIKFLTKLDRPVMWRGYPFLISSIINEDIANNVYLDATDTTTPADYAGKIIEFDLNQIITDKTVDTIDIAIFEDYTTDVQLSEALTIELRDACANPIMLMARNSLGGVLQWLFDINQEYTFDYGNGIKSKRLILTAVNLTLNEWEALQDFIGLGEVYRENIVEFTSATIKTHSRIGSQVYIVDTDGSKIGVIVMPTKNATMSKKRRHTFELEIEYPQTFLV